MTIKLIRNLETNRNYDQEYSFESTFNIPLFFISNKIITKIDGWKKSNVKKLLKNINNDLELEIHFSKWNENINMLFLSPKITFEINNVLSEEMKKIILSKNIKKISKLILDIEEDKNIKYEIVLFLLSLIKNNKKMIFFSNFIINEAVLTVDLLLEILISKFMSEDDYE